MEGRIKAEKHIHIKVDVKYHDMLKRLAVRVGLSITEIHVQYYEYLMRMHNKERKVLDGKSEAVFKLDGTKPRFIRDSIRDKQKQEDDPGL